MDLWAWRSVERRFDVDKHDRCMCRQVDAMTEEQLKDEFLLVGKIIQHLIRQGLSLSHSHVVFVCQ